MSDTMPTWLVRVDYRTTTTCNSKTFTVSAPDEFGAIAAASDKMRQRRGVYKIDGGTVLGHALVKPAA